MLRQLVVSARVEINRVYIRDTSSTPPPSESLAPARLRLAGTSDTSVVVGDGVSIDINSVYLYPSRN